MSGSTVWKIRISDTFCEWEFYLQGGADYSIDDLIQIIKVHTRMAVIDECLVVPETKPTNSEQPRLEAL